MRILFYKQRFGWPRSSGHDVHTYNMMRAMDSLGAKVGLVTRFESADDALRGIDLELRVVLEAQGNGPHRPISLNRMEERFRSYWGIEQNHIASFADHIRRFRPDTVVVSGLDVLPMLAAAEGPMRVWYAADEWFWHHASQVRLNQPATWSEIRAALVKGLYERAYRRRIDEAWVVTDADARAFRVVTGVRTIRVLPNGVDSGWYAAIANPGRGDTAVFWGRLDFGPNIQALEWFCTEVWPAIMRLRPQAQFTIIGFNPSPAVETLARQPGISLRPDVPDVREEVGEHAVVVLPFVSGGGIKNKLLEAAAMARPLVCSRRALLGLKGDVPIRAAGTPAEWVSAITELWDSPMLRSTYGSLLRTWVERDHTWDAVASAALRGLEQRATRLDASRGRGPTSR
jgi:glycosyltransferase involved in cell wall biosynthesis